MKRLLYFIALATISILSVLSCQQEPAEIRAASISLSKSTLELTVGDQASLDATVSPDNATNKKIRWSSSKESVATVTPDGIVEAVSAGTAFITATSEDSGVNAKCEITVKEKAISVTGIALNKTSLSLSVEEEFTLEATITPDNATNMEITWASDNEAVVTVSSAGVVKALRVGTASITATTVDQGKSASCAVTVAEIMGAVTGEATHISCRNAKISGKANTPPTTSTNLSFGVLYATSSGVLLGSATQLEAKDFDADFNYTIDSGVLEPETTYYYRSYIIQNDEVEYGETKSFKTLAVSSMIQTLDAGDVYHKEATLNAMLDLTDCKYNNIEYGFEITPEGGQAKTLTASNLAGKAFSYLDNSLVMKTGYSYVAYVRLDDILYKGEPKTFTTPAPPTPTLVDLGLSVKWASFNLGASKPTEYGGYYQWAGTEDVSDTSIWLFWDNCPYHTGSDRYLGWTKYNTDSSIGTVDNKTVLESMDDAASVALGGKWRIPTDEELTELRNTDNCSWTWTTIDGVNGYKIQSKKSGYTDNWIFLPAAGARNDYGLFAVGSGGCCWSSSINTDNESEAYSISFGFFNVYGGPTERYSAISIRPVSE